MKGASVVAAMSAAADRWLSRHRDHAGQIKEIDLSNTVEWPAGTRVLRHFRCNECRDELKLEMTIGAA